jgi:hypothetical protein
VDLIRAGAGLARSPLVSEHHRHIHASSTAKCAKRLAIASTRTLVAAAPAISAWSTAFASGEPSEARDRGRRGARLARSLERREARLVAPVWLIAKIVIRVTASGSPSTTAVTLASLLRSAGSAERIWASTACVEAVEV